MSENGKRQIESTHVEQTQHQVHVRKAREKRMLTRPRFHSIGTHPPAQQVDDLVHQLLEIAEHLHVGIARRAEERVGDLV